MAPQGNNALEYYLRVLDKEPNNQTAKDALREMFPFATPVVEQNINAGNVDEATREIDLLAKVDPNNYTLTILRQKLDAKKKVAEHDQQQQAAAAAATAAAAAAKTAAGTTAASASSPAPAATAPASAPANPTPTVAAQSRQLRHRPPPRAQRQRQPLP